MEPGQIRDLLEQCNSDEPLERFEAFEEIWSLVLHQGTPSSAATTILPALLNWINSGHQDWPDILSGIQGCALDLAEGPTRPFEENSRRVALLNAIRQAGDIFEEALGRACVKSEGSCQIHLGAAEILRLVRWRLLFMIQVATETCGKPSIDSTPFSICRNVICVSVPTTRRRTSLFAVRP
jgi:hypothetical protein